MNNGKIQDFTDLDAWKYSHILVLEVYKLTKKFPKSELFGLISQIQRASVSITSNTAEGFGRSSYKEKVQFYYIADGSLIEVKNQIIISKDLGYIDISSFEQVSKKILNGQKLLQSLIKKSKSFILSKP